MKTLSDTPIKLDRQQIGEIIDTDYANSAKMKKLHKKITELAREKKNIVFFGEVGTGKQHFADLVHTLSAFSKGTFKNVYCISLDELLEQRDTDSLEISHEPQRSRFLDELGIDVLSGGTLFLNSFSELNRQNQETLMKLLREAQMWAATQENIPNSRIIISVVQEPGATLNEAIDWERLINYSESVVVPIPPLRDRCEDIPVLIDQFLIEYAQRNDIQVHAISFSAAYKCISHYWPGNVLQLKNIIEHATTIAPPGTVITNDHLPFSIDWKSPSAYMNFDQNESFKRAEKLLLTKLASQSNLSSRELNKIKNKFRMDYESE